MTSKPTGPEDAMVARLEDQTGKTLAQWHALLRTKKLAKHGEMVQLLKAEHGVGHGYANLIVHKFREAGAGPAAGDDLVAAQFAGLKAALRPIYEAIAAKVRAFGPDVELAPKKAYVSLRRTKQFALLQPSTATRLDVGVKLPGVKPAGRLEASGSFNAMVTHRVRVAAVRDVDAELVGWLRRAYDAA